MGWGSYGSMQYKKSVEAKTFTKWLTPNNDYYFHYFYLCGDNYRESCYCCKYAKSTREGDFTLGDYWGIQKYHPEMNTKDGVGLVLVNTEKAKRVFSEISVFLETVQSTLDYATDHNRNLVAPSTRPARRDRVYNEILDEGFEKAAKQNIRLRRFLPWIKRKTPSQVKKILKSVLFRKL
jgi:hypothetical protein